MASKGSVCVLVHVCMYSPVWGCGVGVKGREVKLQKRPWSETDMEPGRMLVAHV